MSADIFDAIVIGSGLGGLTAGALYARAGHRVLILERNADFGGAATTYQHGALTIESSLHEVSDPHNPRDAKGRILKALGIMDDLEFVPVGDFQQIRGKYFEQPFTLPHGFDKAQGALTSRFPDHQEAFARLFEKFKTVQEGLAVIGEQHDSWWWFTHAPSVPLKLWPLLRDMRLSLTDVFDELFGDDESPKMAIAANLNYYADDPDTLWWLYYAIAQGDFLSSGGTFIKGGSGRLSAQLVGVIEQEGGAALAKRTVTEILMDAGEAVGVAHTARDGSDRLEAFAPVLFGNAAPSVLAKALPQEVRETFLKPYKDRKPSTSLFSIALGLDKHPGELGFTHYSTLLIPNWIDRLSDYSQSATLLAKPPGEDMPVIAVVDYSAVDSGLNREAPYLISVVGADRVANWEQLDKEAYNNKRDTWLTAIITEIDRTFPGFEEAVVQREMATALTMRNYLNTPEGAIYGFAQEPPKGRPVTGSEKGVRTTIPGLWLASAYGGMGSFSGAMLTGALAAQSALKEE